MLIVRVQATPQLHSNTLPSCSHNCPRVVAVEAWLLGGATNQFHAAAGPSVASSPRVARPTSSRATEYRTSATLSNFKPIHAGRPNFTAAAHTSLGPPPDANHPTPPPSSRHKPSRRIEQNVVAAERAQALEAELEHARAVAVERGATAAAAVTHAAQLSEALAEREEALRRAAEALEAKEALLAHEHKWGVAAVSHFAAKASLTEAARHRMREEGINAMHLRRANRLEDQRLQSTATELEKARHSAAACRRKHGGGKKRDGKKRRTGSGKKRRGGKKQRHGKKRAAAIAAGSPRLEGAISRGALAIAALSRGPFLDAQLPKLPERVPNVSEVLEVEEVPEEVEEPPQEASTQEPPQPTPKAGDHAAAAATVLFLPFPAALPSPERLELSLPLALARAAFARRVRAPASSAGSQPAVSTALAVQAAPLQVMPPLASAAAFKRQELEMPPPGARAEWFKASVAARIRLSAAEKAEPPPAEHLPTEHPPAKPAPPKAASGALAPLEVAQGANLTMHGSAELAIDASSPQPEPKVGLGVPIKPADSEAAVLAKQLSEFDDAPPWLVALRASLHQSQFQPPARRVEADLPPPWLAEFRAALKTSQPATHALVQAHALRQATHALPPHALPRLKMVDDPPPPQPAPPAQNPEPSVGLRRPANTGVAIRAPLFWTPPPSTPTLDLITKPDAGIQYRPSPEYNVSVRRWSSGSTVLMLSGVLVASMLHKLPASAGSPFKLTRRANGSSAAPRPWSTAAAAAAGATSRAIVASSTAAQPSTALALRAPGCVACLGLHAASCPFKLNDSALSLKVRMAALPAPPKAIAGAEPLTLPAASRATASAARETARATLRRGLPVACTARASPAHAARNSSAAPRVAGNVSLLAPQLSPPPPSFFAPPPVSSLPRAPSAPPPAPPPAPPSAPPSAPYAPLSAPPSAPPPAPLSPPSAPPPAPLSPPPSAPLSAPRSAPPIRRAAWPPQPSLRGVPFTVPTFTPFNFYRPAEEADYRPYVGNNRGDKYLAWCRMHACANTARAAWCEAGGHAACRNECARDGSSTCRAADLSITLPPTADADAKAVLRLPAI